mmetsp:Transcript_32993/g.102351  ORF Transcript_32993/g.102351 Transcript_32993/m.102351 type:complete len:221 (-) Transcript_32993:813-1475(-)
MMPSGAMSRTFLGSWMPYCKARTSESPVIGVLPSGANSRRLVKGVPSMSRVAVLRSPSSLTATVQTLPIGRWSSLRPSTRPVVSSVVPCSFVSKTLNMTDRSPTRRNLQSHSLSPAMFGHSAVSQSASKSEELPSTRTLPSTIKQTISLFCSSPVSAMSVTCFMLEPSKFPPPLRSWAPAPLTFFSMEMVCSAKGPRAIFQAALILVSAENPMDRTSIAM